MADELHEISASIGWLKAEAESSRRGREVLHQKLDAMLTVQHQMLTAQQASNANVASLQEAVNEIKPEVDHWRNLRNRAIGGLAIAGLSVSAGTAAAVRAVDKWLGTP